MSVENIVLFNRQRLISPSQWQSALTAAGFDLTLDPEFEPDGFSGYLPCTLNGAACGFEFFLEDLDPELATSLGVSLAPDWNSSLILVTRSSLHDLAAASLAAATWAEATAGGLLASGEGPLITADAARAWARAQLQDIDAQHQRERQAATARAGVLANGSPAQSLEVLLRGLTGQPVKEFKGGGNALAVVTDDGHAIYGSAWRLKTGQAVYEVGREARVQSRLQALLADAPEEMDAERQLAWAALADELEAASASDETDFTRIVEFLTPIDAIHIAAVEWRKPDALAISFAGRAQFEMEYFLAGLMPELTVRTGELKYRITPDEVHLA